MPASADQWSVLVRKDVKLSVCGGANRQYRLFQLERHEAVLIVFPLTAVTGFSIVYPRRFGCVRCVKAVEGLIVELQCWTHTHTSHWTLPTMQMTLLSADHCGTHTLEHNYSFWTLNVFRFDAFGWISFFYSGG